MLPDLYGLRAWAHKHRTCHINYQVIGLNSWWDIVNCRPQYMSKHYEIMYAAGIACDNHRSCITTRRAGLILTQHWCLKGEQGGRNPLDISWWVFVVHSIDIDAPWCRCTKFWNSVAGRRQWSVCPSVCPALFVHVFWMCTDTLQCHLKYTHHINIRYIYYTGMDN